ncbi:MAG: exodeoxyribonuclease VII small subunit [Chloroflexi bacterium]|nr:exodeoxyribonuclease VII small subunit [Chloroflexota bacterium]
MAKRDGRQDEPFEALYRKLEDSVEKLEKGGLSLEESITLYEEGMELAKRCQALLDGAEQRITKLRESFAQPAPAPASTEEEAAPGQAALQPEED